MCTSLVIWYIVDGHTAGVIVFLFIFVFVEFYFLMKYPRFVIVALLSIVTQGGEMTWSFTWVLLMGHSLDNWI